MKNDKKGGRTQQKNEKLNCPQSVPGGSFLRYKYFKHP